MEEKENDMIRLVNVNKSFGDLHVLKDVNLSVKEGEKLVIIGPSGSGKSTSIRCMNFLERPTSGDVYIAGEKMTHKNCTRLIRENVSMVFQQFNLYPHMTVLKNLTLAPVMLKLASKQEAEETAYKYLEVVGLKNKVDAYPTQLSGGQCQRVAIARAIIGNPEIILADEPTGNLDSKMGAEVMELLHQLNKEDGRTIVMVTHNEEQAKQTSRTVRFFDGRQVE